MGSTSDWETMQHAAAQLEALGVPYEKRVVSAHRTPKLMVDYAESAEQRGLIASEWQVTEKGRRAKYYRLTTQGRRAVGVETSNWRRYVQAVEHILAVS